MPALECETIVANELKEMYILNCSVQIKKKHKKRCTLLKKAESVPGLLRQ